MVYIVTFLSESPLYSSSKMCIHVMSSEDESSINRKGCCETFVSRFLLLEPVAVTQETVKQMCGID